MSHVVRMALLVLLLPLVGGGAPVERNVRAEADARCNVTVQGFHGGASDTIYWLLARSQRRIQSGWWKSMRDQVTRNVSLDPGDHFSVVLDLDQSCGAARLYQFYFYVGDQDGEQTYTHHYPGGPLSTRERVIDLGDVSRFFPTIAPALPGQTGPSSPPGGDTPGPVLGADLQGEWIRQDSNNHRNDGMRIVVQGDRAVLTSVPSSATHYWQAGEVLWQGIQPDGALEVLGSNDGYYDAQLIPRGTDRLDVDIAFNGAGDDQTWVRGQPIGTSGDSDPSEDANAGTVETRQQALTVLAGSVWSSQDIPVCWEDTDADEADERRWSREAVEETWERESGVDFTGWGQCDDDDDGVRILVKDDADEGPKVRALGTELDGRENGMILNFTFENWDTTFGCADGSATRTAEEEREWCIRVIAVHEFGHAMGIAHEHKHSDTPFNCSSGNTNGTVPDWDVTPYDLFSVMNYCGPMWGGRGMLSPSDIQGAVRLYGSAEHNVLGEYEDGDQFGAAVAAGDFDGDGLDDLAIGAPGESPGDRPRSGSVFLYRGTEAGGLRPWGLLNQATLGLEEAGDQFGTALVASDFDGDGLDDLAVGAPGEAPGDDPKSGAVFLFRGTADGAAPWMALTQRGLGDNEAFDGFGRALAAADLDGDGRLDLAVGAPGEQPGDGPRNSGAVYLFRGTASALEPWHAQTQDPLSTPHIGDWFGGALATGDFDGDGTDDLAVGAHGKNTPDASNAGAVFVFRGGPDRLRPWTRLDQTGLGDNEPSDWFGRALAAGDLNGDGVSDLAVGAPREGPFGGPRSGAVFVFTGGASALSPFAVLDQSGLGENEEGDGFGSALAVADLDGNDIGDLIVGAAGEAPSGAPQSGAVFVFAGRPAEIVPVTVLDQAGLGRNEAGDGFGTALAVGRFSDHAFDHFVIGAPGEAPGDEPASGYVFAFALLDDDPSGAPPLLRGWYAFGQKY